MLCDRTCAIAAFAIAATAVGGALYRGDSEGGLLTRPEAALVLATVALLLLTFTHTYTNGTRRWAVAAYRVLACALLPPGSGKSADQLQHAAAGPALDAVRVLIGECGHLPGGIGVQWTQPFTSATCCANVEMAIALAVRSSARAKQP